MTTYCIEEVHEGEEAAWDIKIIEGKAAEHWGQFPTEAKAKATVVALEWMRDLAEGKMSLGLVDIPKEWDIQFQAPPKPRTRRKP